MLLRDQEGCVARVCLCECVWGGGGSAQIFHPGDIECKTSLELKFTCTVKQLELLLKILRYLIPSTSSKTPPVTHLATGWSTDTAESRCSRFIQRFHFSANSSACFEKCICEATKGRCCSPEAPTWVINLLGGKKRLRRHQLTWVMQLHLCPTWTDSCHIPVKINVPWVQRCHRPVLHVSLRQLQLDWPRTPARPAWGTPQSAIKITNQIWKTKVVFHQLLLSVAFSCRWTSRTSAEGRRGLGWPPN